MVAVKGYVRSGDTIFWQTPNGKMMRVGTSRLISASQNVIKKLNKASEINSYKLMAVHRSSGRTAETIIPAYSKKQAEAYFLKLNPKYWSIVSVEQVR